MLGKLLKEEDCLGLAIPGDGIGIMLVFLMALLEGLLVTLSLFCCCCLPRVLQQP